MRNASPRSTLRETMTLTNFHHHSTTRTAAPLLTLLLMGMTLASTLWAEQTAIEGPDVTVIYLPNISHWQDSGAPGVHAYAVGTTSCNIGTEPLWWCNDEGDPFCETNQHPVIGQNLYRLKDDRFEQIGMSWLKHGFFSVNSNDPACGNCQQPPHGGDQLGVGCTDPYGSGLNGSRPLGMRSEVNAATGEFPYPYTEVPSPTQVDQRIQVDEADLDPALNPGARYWVEGHYVAADDAADGNALNNASYREVTVESNYDLTLIGSTVREQPAIAVWSAVDPQVSLVDVDIPNSEPTQRFHAARRVSGGGGSWHYEYAIHNLNSDRSARLFRVELDPGATITNAGFHDVEHHSGEPYTTTDWTITVDSPPGSVEWSTDTFATDQNANALRWGTMFTFWFDADVPPAGALHTLELFKPGVPSSVLVEFPDGEWIFQDGFESGDTSNWSSSTQP